MMGGKSGAFRGFSSSCSPYIHTIISSHSHNNNLRNVPMPSRHTKTHACESGRMFPKWTERVNQEPHRGVGSNLAHYLCERSSRFRSCLRHLAEPAGRMKSTAMTSVRQSRKNENESEILKIGFGDTTEERKGRKAASQRSWLKT